MKTVSSLSKARAVKNYIFNWLKTEPISTEKEVSLL